MVELMNYTYTVRYKVITERYANRRQETVRSIFSSWYDGGVLALIDLALTFPIILKVRFSVEAQSPAAGYPPRCGSSSCTDFFSGILEALTPPGGLQLGR